jgi:hypothetical protein
MFHAGSHGGAAGEGRDDTPGCVTRTNATADALSRYHGSPGKHGKITQKFVPALSTSILQGNSAPRQRAAGQIPPKRTGYLNEPPGRRCFPCLRRSAMEAVNGDVR